MLPLVTIRDGVYALLALMTQLAEICGTCGDRALLATLQQLLLFSRRQLVAIPVD